METYRTILQKACIAFCLILAVYQPRTAKTEPITVSILVGLGTSLAITLAYDQFTASFLAISLGYATPEPDANLVWKLGRNELAIAADADTTHDPTTEHVGQAATEVGLIFDSLDPIANSKNSYYNASRIYKNGVLKKSEDGGDPPPGLNAKNMNVDVSDLPLRDSVTLDMHAGKIGSFDTLMGGGAKYTGGQWIRWDSRTETDSTARSYLEGTIVPDPSLSDPVSLVVPSVNQLFSEGQARNAVDWFPYFLSAVSIAGTHEVNGITYFNEFNFAVPLPDSVTTNGDWFTSVELTAQNSVVPEPPIFALIIMALCWLIVYRPLPN